MTQTSHRPGPDPAAEQGDGTVLLTSAEREVLAPAFDALRSRADHIAEAVAAQLLDGGDLGYGLDEPGRAAELRASIRDHVRAGIERLADQRPAQRRAIDLWRETGRRRAQQGVPMEIVLTTYMIGSRLMWEALLEAGHRLDVPDRALMRAGRLLWSTLDVQGTVLRDSYRREELARDQRDPARVAEVLEGLSQGRGAEADFAARARSVLGLDHDSALLVLVWLPPADGPSTPDLVRERLQDAGYLSHWRRQGAHVLGLVPSPDDGTRVRKVLERTVRGRVGSATCRDGLSGVLAAQDSALAAAVSLPRGSDAVVDISERLPEALLAASPSLTTQLVEATLGPLLSVGGVTREVLLETLVAVLRHGGSATYAAEDLVCHRNTVIYRVKRVEELTGLSLDDPRDRLLLTLAATAIDSGLAGLGSGADGEVRS